MKNYEEAEKTFALAISKTDGSSKKMDVRFNHLNCHIWDDRWDQFSVVVGYLDELDKDARDWQAKNKLKV